mgnify:CR=1 FL=1
MRQTAGSTFTVEVVYEGEPGATPRLDTPAYYRWNDEFVIAGEPVELRIEEV